MRALLSSAPGDPPAGSRPPGAVIVRRNPFDATDRMLAPLLAPSSLADLARAHGVDPKAQPVIARCDGRLVLQRDWASRVATATSIVEFESLPAGGGGGGGGKNTIGLVLSIAVSVLAMAVAGPLAGAIGFTAGTFAFTAASAAISAAIAIGGTLLINAIIPPQAAAGYQSATGGQASPTYTLAARGNQARAFAVTTPHRNAANPEVPTWREGGVDAEMSVWQAVFMPSATTRDRRDVLNTAINRALGQEALRKRLADLGADRILSLSVAESEAYLAAEVTRWEALLKR
jgi:hypothetical protein